MSFIDSHCHLKSFSEQKNLDEILKRACNSGINKMITVGTNPDDWDLYESLANVHKDTLFYTVGLHPCYVEGNWRCKIKNIKKYWLLDLQPVALGEIGLDYFRLPKDKITAQKIILFQKECFVEQLRVAKKIGCPVIVHSRNSFEDCLSLVDQSGVNWKKVVFHCFSEGENKIKQIMERGGAASFTGNITYSKNDHLRDSLKFQGITNLMLETDSPYLTPEPNRREQNEPSNLRQISQYISSILGVSEKEIGEFTSLNTQRFFNLDG